MEVHKSGHLGGRFIPFFVSHMKVYVGIWRGMCTGDPHICT